MKIIKMKGIDNGLTNSIVTSDGKFYGNEIRNLRIRTKHREYTQISPQKQSLNKIGKELIKEYPDTNFIVEDLLFKGKKKRTKEFRRRNNNWAYNYLGNKLEEHGKLEGFSVIRINPAYTSQTCPNCGNINEVNRVGENFKCISCGYINHTDIVGAINLVERVAREFSTPLKETYR